MTYTEEIATTLIDTLSRTAGLPTFQLAGHVPNLAFWINEVRHALNVIADYPRHFVSMARAQAAFDAEHPSTIREREHHDYKYQPLRQSVSPELADQLSRRLNAVSKRLIDRCLREGFIGIVAADDLRAALDRDSPATRTDQMLGVRVAHLRIARPTDNLAAVVRFYCDGLGFEVLSEFTGHDGFDGAMLGHEGAAYHLEFTHKAGEEAGRAPSAENLLVLYLPDAAMWRSAIERLAGAGHSPVKAFNPYWDRHGTTFEDPDGYRVVLQNAAWQKDTSR